jgi:hypothetical protein
MGGTRILENARCSQSHVLIEHRGLQNRAKHKLFDTIFAFSIDNRLIIKTKHPQGHSSQIHSYPSLIVVLRPARTTVHDPLPCGPYLKGSPRARTTHTRRALAVMARRLQHWSRGGNSELAGRRWHDSDTWMLKRQHGGGNNMVASSMRLGVDADMVGFERLSV